MSQVKIVSFIKISWRRRESFSPSTYSIRAGLSGWVKQAETIAIQRGIDHLGEQYYDSLINVMEYLDGLSFTVAKRKKMTLCNIFFSF